ncbi:type II secretion system protein [Paucibacter soli]|uniref:type II secretion system protein n=1 Tax=Paucibacter soli TaxID=3133433 RepID=UPI0030A543AC
MKNRGLTLLEMLVSLVMVSMISALLGQALMHLRRIEELLDGGRLHASVEGVRMEWIRSALESLLPAPISATERFRGTERELTGLSADAPTPPSPGVGSVTFSVVYDAVLDQTSLEMRTGAAEEAPQVRLLRWRGKKGGFRYMDGAGAWRDTWPDPQRKLPALPRAIALDMGEDPPGQLVAVVRAYGTESVPTRAALENL